MSDAELSAITRLRSGRMELALHALEPGAEGHPPLLLLHGLRESSRVWRKALVPWEGPIWALDFAAHGQSGRPIGGGFSPESFATDADQALAELGPCAIAGRGIGAYVALLLSGAQPEEVRATLLLPGPGLDGGGEHPQYDARPMPPTDPLLARNAELDPALERCEVDPRPRAYAAAFADAAKGMVWLETGTPRPPWWHAARDAAPGAIVAPTGEAAFAALARLAGSA